MGACASGGSVRAMHGIAPAELRWGIDGGVRLRRLRAGDARHRPDRAALGH
jgi:hypothetical protein